MSELKVVVVTPERTTLEQAIESVVVPMFDGELGVLKGHAPMIGALGPGELRATWDGQTHRYYVDGGFVQVLDNVVTVLTGRSVPADEIDLEAAQKALHEAEEIVAETNELMDIKRRAIAQAQAQIRIAESR